MIYDQSEAGMVPVPSNYSIAEYNLSKSALACFPSSLRVWRNTVFIHDEFEQSENSRLYNAYDRIFKVFPDIEETPYARLILNYLTNNISYKVNSD